MYGRRWSEEAYICLHADADYGDAAFCRAHAKRVPTAAVNDGLRRAPSCAFAAAAMDAETQRVALLEWF